MTSSISSSSSVISCAFPPVTSSIHSVMSDLLWVIGVGVIDPWMNLVFTMFPLNFFTVIRWFIILAAMHQSPQLFLFPLHILTAVLGLLLVAVWFLLLLCVYIFFLCVAIHLPEGT